MSRMQKGIRSFIAIDIPEEILVKLDPLLSDLSQLGADLRIVRRENLHFTMKFLGNISEEMIEPVGECLRSVAGMLGFDMKIRGFGAFPNTRKARVVWVGTSSEGDRMVRLAESLDERLSKLGFTKERSHIPHLTLARCRSGRGKPALIRFIERMEDIEIDIMRVDRIVLKKSVLTPKGPIYTDILAVESPGE